MWKPLYEWVSHLAALYQQTTAKQTMFGRDCPYPFFEVKKAEKPKVV